MQQQHETPQTRRIAAILKRPANKLCFECSAKQPRWGSTNLGILFCIRCAGFFRSLGVHICKVKSTNMDVWDDSMIDVIDRIGNENGRLLYEARLPPGFARIDQFTDSSVVERAIRLKYGTRNYWDEDYDQKYVSFMERGTPSPTSDVSLIVNHSRSRSDVSSNICSSMGSSPVTPIIKGVVCSPVSTSKASARTVISDNTILQGSVVGGSKPAIFNDTSFFDVPNNKVAALTQSQNPPQSANIHKNGCLYDDLFSVQVSNMPQSSSSTSKTKDLDQREPAKAVSSSSGLDLFINDSKSVQRDTFLDDILDMGGTSSKVLSNKTPEIQHSLHPFDSSAKGSTGGCSVGYGAPSMTYKQQTDSTQAMAAALSGLSGDGSGRPSASNGGHNNNGMFQSSIVSGARERAW